MARTTPGTARDLGRVLVEAGSDEELDLGWLAGMKLPLGSTLEYGAVGSRANFVLRTQDAERSAVCDLKSGEYVLGRPASTKDPLTDLLLHLLEARLLHLRDLPFLPRQADEGSLSVLANMTGGVWFPYESLPRS